jgi:chromosome segregation ATPase
MKRYMALLKDMESAGYMTLDEEGDWVRYEDAAALAAQLEEATEKLAASNEQQRATLEARVHEAESAITHQIQLRGAAEAQVSELTRELDEAERYLEEYKRDRDAWRVRAEKADAAQAAAKASHAELEELRARVTRAVAVLATPGTWSDFAQRALKELRGG